MQENRNDSALRLLVTGTRRDCRRRYDLQSKRALARACLQPGVSLAGMALKHGVNANLLDADLKVYLHREAVDFRKSINGLATLVEQSMGRDPFARVVYAIRNRRYDRITLMLYNRTGFWLLMQRLDLPRKRVEYDLSDDQKICGCCQGALHRIGEDISEQRAPFIPRPDGRGFLEQSG